MELGHLALREFRNYRQLDLSLGPGMVIFHGPNGGGKTNLLEAICVASSGDSPRARETVEMVRVGARHGFTAGRFRGEGREVELEVGLARSGQRQIKVNGVLRRRVDLIGRAPVVYFSADDLGVIKGEPSARRRLVDAELGAISRSYHHHLQRYRRAVEQRNRLLKDLRGGRRAGSELDSWDRAAARYGARVMVERSAFIGPLGREAGRAQARLMGGGRPFVVGYRPSVAFPNEQRSAGDGKEQRALVEEISAALGAALRAQRELDIGQGVTGCGPHRDDLDLLLGGEPLRAFGSQGEQRACAVAVRLGLAAVVHQMTGQRPLLLLDDVLSELDAGHRAGVFAASREADQVVITCCDVADIPAQAREEATEFEVRDGGVV